MSDQLDDIASLLDDTPVRKVSVVERARLFSRELRSDYYHPVRDVIQGSIQKLPPVVRSFIYYLGAILLLIQGFLIVLVFANSFSRGDSFNFLYLWNILRDFFRGNVDMYQFITDSNTSHAALYYGFPIILAAVGAAFNESSGIINIGLEGLMICSAWGSVYFLYFFSTRTGGAIYLGTLLGITIGVLVSLIFAFFTIHLKANQIVSAVGINFAALGLMLFLTSIVWEREQSDGVSLYPSINLYGVFQNINTFLIDLSYVGGIYDFFWGLVVAVYDFARGLGIIGWLLGIEPFLLIVKFVIDVFNEQPLLLFIGIFFILLSHILLFKTTFGLRIRAIGENPEAAATAGINIKLYQYFAVVYSGFMASLGGCFIAIAIDGQFTKNTVNGQGFLALVALVFGKWTVVGAFLSALFFGYLRQFNARFQFIFHIESFVLDIDDSLLNIIPFIIAVLAVSGIVRRARAPKGLGVVYDPESKN